MPRGKDFPEATNLLSPTLGKQMATGTGTTFFGLLIAEMLNNNSSKLQGLPPVFSNRIKARSGLTDARHQERFRLQTCSAQRSKRIHRNAFAINRPVRRIARGVTVFSDKSAS